jgi:hypothetical protein
MRHRITIEFEYQFAERAFQARRACGSGVSEADLACGLETRRAPIGANTLGKLRGAERQPADKVANHDSMANPASLDWFVGFARAELAEPSARMASASATVRLERVAAGPRFHQGECLVGGHELGPVII